MEDDDFDEAEYLRAVSTPRKHTLGTTLDEFGAQQLRALLTAGPDAFSEEFDGDPYDAAHLLQCYDLASLLGWDEQALVDAATMNQGGEECRIGWGGEPLEAVKRRVQLAMKAESAPDVLRPIDGALLLHRAGLKLDYYLREAVVLETCGADDFTERDAPLVRKLLGIPAKALGAHVTAIVDCSTLDASSWAGRESTPAPVAGPVDSDEDSVHRQDRRLARLVELGDDMREIAGGAWHTVARNGSLAKLIREEVIRQRPMRHERTEYERQENGRASHRARIT
ncbi:MAG: hypothetical protein ACSLE9_19190 [Burkholderiaceae bacterium]